MALPLLLTASPTPAQPAAAPELRAIWVDAFHAGIRSPAEAANLVSDAKRIHANTLIVQVRRRGDALYTGGLEPPLDDTNYQPSFDALAHIVSAAHAAGLQVHAWINAMPVWRDEAPPSAARHVFNLHGPAATGDACWLTAARDGTKKFPVGYFLDPGHPAAQDHLVTVYLDIVRRYDVDGIHFDYMRYPETEGPALPRGADVGYNPVSVARFQRATGRTDVPAPDDQAWIDWRRRQVTQLMRHISIEARAIKPRIKVGAATIAWGRPPESLADFKNVAPMQRVFQDWQGWLAEGLLDLAVPMNYAREHDERVRGWFNGWIAWEKKHKADRQLAVGIGGYLSAPEGRPGAGVARAGSGGTGARRRRVVVLVLPAVDGAAGSTGGTVRGGSARLHASASGPAAALGRAGSAGLSHPRGGRSAAGLHRTRTRAADAVDRAADARVHRGERRGRGGCRHRGPHHPRAPHGLVPQNAQDHQRREWLVRHDEARAGDVQRSPGRFFGTAARGAGRGHHRGRKGREGEAHRRAMMEVEASASTDTSTLKRRPPIESPYPESRAPWMELAPSA